ncbi:hypothetical protein ACLMJK_006417 [Lecanora helva]
MAPSATISPTTNAGNGCWSSPASSQHSNPLLAKQQQQVNTSVSLTVTPATALTPNGTSTTATPSTVSLQSSPEGPRGRNLPADFSPSPLHLPEPTTTIPSSPQFHSAMSEAMATSRGQGLIRRLSRGAANRLRRRQSSNHLSNRDRSSGPVMLRRRSNSKNDVEDIGSCDNDFEADIEENLQEDPDPMQELKKLPTEGLNDLHIDDGTSSLRPSLTEGGIAPIVPSVLRRGTPLTKVTKNKRKQINFLLDTDSAKVKWDRINPSKQFYIDDIQQIRLQRDARNYREEFGVPFESESRWFTIIYADHERGKGRPMKTIHLLAPNQITFELWTSTLDDLQRYRHELMNGVAGSRLNERTLRGHWKCEMAKMFNGRDHDESEENLDFAGLESICHGFHIHCSTNMLRAQFEKADKGGTGYLNFSEFSDFIRRLKQRNDIKDIYKSINGNHQDGISLEVFLQFLRDTQCINIEADRYRWVRVYNKHIRQANKCPTPQDGTEDPTTRMNFAAFSDYLCSDDNNVQNFYKSEVRFDKPLNEYFISSSHNTYLTGRQVAGNSSTEAYIRALQRGCRCVEIDCWDGPDGRPIVLHGRTMTTSVMFSDCISVIGRYAFEASPYPLTLSLEVHCRPEQQQSMVEIMKDELGDQLLWEPLVTNAFQLPSPEELRNKILIKVKSGEDSGSPHELTNGRRERSFSSPWSRPQTLDNSTVPSSSLVSSPSSASPPEHASTWNIGRGSITTTSISSGTEDSDAGAHNEKRNQKRQQPKKHTSKITKALGSLGVYTQGLTFNNFTSSESKTFNHVFSIAERRFLNLCHSQDSKVQLEQHNMRHLMRVYPSGWRVTSSNPDPLLFWRRGVQMMALNWQTYDLPMQMNEAMFASGSDKLGYVLKPRELRESLSLQEEIEEPSIHGLGKIQKKLIRFSVEVISAQQLPRPRGIAPDSTLDPYIEIEMFCAEDKTKGIVSGEGGQDASARNGMSGIGSPHRRRTHVVQANGFNPVFNEDFKLSVETKYPSLVFVRWTVWNSQDGRNYNNNANASPLAVFTAKLSSLEQGYRHLRLFDHNGDQFNCATLFCKIKKEEAQTVEKEDPVPEKGGRFKRGFNNSAFKRTKSIEKRNGVRSDRKASTASTSKSTSGEKLGDEG